MNSVSQLTEDVAEVIPKIDRETTGQYGDGIGSEDEERQVELILEKLQETDNRYQKVEREARYPNSSTNCDLVLSDGTPVEAKLLRYWRANGDPEDYMYTHIFIPFHENTLLTDARRLHESDFNRPQCLLGLFYERADDDPKEPISLPERLTARNLAEKVVQDVEYWCDFELDVHRIERFGGLRHTVHKQGAVVTWIIE